MPHPVAPGVLRAIDANQDRCSEGLRVLEDVARFTLDDATLTATLRDIRHQLGVHLATLDSALLAARQAATDVGGPDAATSPGHNSLSDLVRANAKRAEEALRVIEEYARLPELSATLSTSLFSSLRFAVYETEQVLISTLERRDRAALVKGVYVILDPAATHGRDELEVAEAALLGGAAVLQYRDKERERGLQLPILQELRTLCQEHHALLIVNDDPALALAAQADGVHLGQKDLPLRDARAMLPPSMLIGVSCALSEEAQQADAAGADYIAVGSIYATQSKDDTRPAGLHTLRAVRSMTTRPIVAIGGINAENVAPVIQAGADAVAVISAIAGAADPQAATTQLRQQIEECYEPTRNPA